MSALVGTIKKVMPSVVAIVITKHLSELQKEVPHELAHLFKGKKKLDIPPSLIDEHGMVKIGGGSGFLVERNGLIATNKHVVSDSFSERTIILNDNRTFPATVVCVDPVNDIALLKIEAANLPYLYLGDPHRLELGETVLAIGNALGLFKNTVSAGIVSGLSRSIVAEGEEGAPPQEMRGLIQTDAAINLGNSGGPLVTLDGKAVGINTATVSGALGIGFAIPITPLKRDLHDLHYYGRIRRPLLGVRYITIDKTYQEKMNLSASSGAYVIQEGKDEGVVPGSPAARAGVKDGDIILEFDKRPISRDTTIQDYLADCTAGQTVTLTLQRKNKKLKVKVKLTERK
ncbi:MAG: trypsin-like peptidase domain-containing protein [Patescibacteria group bacterium]